MQIPILSGVYSQRGPDFEASYPLNLVPNFQKTSISGGYLRSAPGIDTFAIGAGTDRGGYNWNDTLYRVSGTKLISVSSTGIVTIVGDVGGSTRVTLTSSFDRLAIASNEQLWYYNGTTLSQVTDTDLGVCLDIVWQDGYFISTDGTSIVLTDLNDPTSVNPLAYGSAEADPDSILGLLTIRGELYVLGQRTIEVFYNTGVVTDAAPDPFARQRGAQIDKGIVGTHAKTLFLDTFAFCGAGRNEQPKIYVAGQGVATPISTRGIERILGDLSSADLATIVLETRNSEGSNTLYVHLPDQTLCYDHEASQAAEEPIWYRLASGVYGNQAYRARNFTYAYGQWHCGDIESSNLGVLVDTDDLQFGEQSIWQFDCALIYGLGSGGSINDMASYRFNAMLASWGGGAICHNLELIGFYGRALPGKEPIAFMSWTDDGLTFSQERAAKTGFSGQRSLRVAWRRNGFFRNWRGFRFRGVTGTPISFSRLEAQLEPLNNG
jgi:hypothetical protein